MATRHESVFSNVMFQLSSISNSRPCRQSIAQTALLCTQGGIYRTKAKGMKPQGGVSLVLGAGNQASVISGDILFKLIHEDEVVIVKTNPVNEYVGKYLE